MVHRLENPQIILHGLNDVETVANALAVYVEHLTEKYGSADPEWMEGPWRGGNAELAKDCLHRETVDVTVHGAEVPSATDELCTRCNAVRTRADALDAVRGTAKDAMTLRQRIVKEWGYDPTHE